MQHHQMFSGLSEQRTGSHFVIAEFNFVNISGQFFNHCSDLTTTQLPVGQV